MFGKTKIKKENPSKVLKVALLGNPNSGKSTLFNALTGLNQQTGNYPGVTVEKHTGEAFLHNPETDETIQVDYLDLPGTYSIYPKTLDEEVCYKILCDETNEDHPDITVIVADATNLRRSLFLATQIIDLGLPCIFVMNMIDFAKIRGVVIDSVSLSESLGIPVLIY